VLQQIALGSVLVLVTVLVHGGCTVVALWAPSVSRVERRLSTSRWAGAMLTAALVLMMLYASLFEALIWALTYLAVGALSPLEEALYFSTVTYTTLGYGDVVLHESWRILAAFQAANGVIMFGWTTALIVAFIQIVRSRRLETPSTNS
jgi:hypothetical protein